MKKVAGLLVAVALLLSACAPERVGIVTPPDKFVNYDPSTADGGLAANVGFQVFNATGTQSWQKTGTGNNAWSAATAVQGGLAAVVPNPVTVDLTHTATGLTIVPAVVGKAFVPVRFCIVVTAVGGSLTTPASINIGSNGSKNNIFASGNSFTNATAFSGGVGWSTCGGPLAGVYAPNTPVLMDVTVATDATTFSVQGLYWGYWL